jgi:diaminobutyrate-2-oxoglutarate transaminase
MGGYHGMSLGGLSVTANIANRASAGVPLDHVTFIPYPHGPIANFDSIAYMKAVLDDTHSGIEKPAAIIVETVQAEGGIVVAPVEWLRRLRALCDSYDILLICDDIQVGCYRTGPFFSFERAGIVPDIVVLSKSISGYGLPMSLVLMKADLDLWQPAEHTGTFRGNQLAFIGAAAALDYSIQAAVEQQVRQKQAMLETFLTQQIRPLHFGIITRGIGMIWGIDLAGVADAQLAKAVARRCFDCGLLVERVGRADTVIKILPPLTIAPDLLEQGLRVIKTAVQDCLASSAASLFVADAGTDRLEVHSGA